MNRFIKYFILPANFLLFALAFPQSLKAQLLTGTFIMSSVGGIENASNNSMAITFISSATCLNVQNGTAVLTGDRGTGNFAINCEVKTMFNSLGIKLYPNPATESIVVQTLDANNNSLVSLIDITGKQLSESVFENGKATFNISKLENGIYFVKQYNTNNAFRFVKQ
jgi:hypothetical protein